MTSIIPRLLIVEDEVAIGKLLLTVLKPAGFEIEIMHHAEGALEALGRYLPELLLIDWMLPGISGLQLIKKLRSTKRTRDLPIIMLTARSIESYRIIGLDSGADDYITKPFSPRELLARIRAVLRRRAPQYVGDIIELHGVRLDPASVSVTVNEQSCVLSLTEFKLLRILMTASGRVFSRNQLLDLAWGDDHYIEERTVDVAIRRLRAALNEAGGDGDAVIETVRGVGYCFKAI